MYPRCDGLLWDGDADYGVEEAPGLWGDADGR